MKIVKIAAVICNVLFWAFFCMVVVTDGAPKGADLLWSLLPFVMPIFNVVVMLVLSSPARVARIVGLIGNIIWLVTAAWLAIERVPSHPQEEGLIEYVVLLVVTPLLSAIALSADLRAAAPSVKNSPA